MTLAEAGAAQLAPAEAAQALCRARRDGRRVMSSLLPSHDRHAAFAIQDATRAALGADGGGKVGASAASVASWMA